jgi:hypothetical protein
MDRKDGGRDQKDLERHKHISMIAFYGTIPLPALVSSVPGCSKALGKTDVIVQGP